MERFLAIIVEFRHFFFHRFPSVIRSFILLIFGFFGYRYILCYAGYDADS